MINYEYELNTIYYEYTTNTYDSWVTRYNIVMALRAVLAPTTFKWQLIVATVFVTPFPLIMQILLLPIKFKVNLSN